jgi:hypothetical protein
MEVFLATLATTVATLLTILLAAITAYFVFLRERTATFSDRIFDERLTIREHLEPLHKLGPADMFAPPNFAKKYRAKYPTKSRVELVSTLASQLFWFDGSRVAKDFIEADKSYGGESWKGRLYFFFLKQSADIIAPQFEQWKPRRETFPFAAVETGFDAWRTEFERLAPSIRDALRLRQSMTEDFARFKGGIPGTPDYYLSSADGFFATVESISASLSKIDKLESSRKRYTFSGLHIRSLSILCFLSFAFGVLIPLVVLIHPGIVTIRVAATLVGIALITTMLSFFQFGRHLFQSTKASSKSERAAYLRLQWYQPLLDQMKAQEEKFSLRGPLDLDFFFDASNSHDLSDDILSDLEEYITTGTKYNEHVQVFVETVLGSFERDTTLAPVLSREFWTKGGRGLCPYDLLNENVIAETVKKLFEKSEGGLSISTFDFQGAIPATGPSRFTIPASMISEGQLLDALQLIHNSLIKSAITLDLQRSHQEVAESGLRLRRNLNDVLDKR